MINYVVNSGKYTNCDFAKSPDILYPGYIVRKQNALEFLCKNLQITRVSHVNHTRGTLEVNHV